jgi:hypothetical protein
MAKSEQLDAGRSTGICLFVHVLFLAAWAADFNDYFRPVGIHHGGKDGAEKGQNEWPREGKACSFVVSAGTKFHHW